LLVVSSADLTTFFRLVGAGDLDELTTFLVTEVERLAQAGAEFASLAANTPHVVLPTVQERSRIPLISIVEVTTTEMTGRGIRSAALGTRFTMQGRFYPDVCERSDIRIVVPQPDEQALIHDKYVTELIPGDIRPSTRDALTAIIQRMIAADGVEGVILGGTELPSILKGDNIGGVPLFDTTAIHVRAIVNEMGGFAL
jgi:aspartate racemase